MTRRLHIIRNYGSRDPMLGAVWIGAFDPMSVPVSEPLAPPLAPELMPDISLQQNHHVIDYWTWRLGKLVDGVNVRVRKG